MASGGKAPNPFDDDVTEEEFKIGFTHRPRFESDDGDTVTFAKGPQRPIFDSDNDDDDLVVNLDGSAVRKKDVPSAPKPTITTSKTLPALQPLQQRTIVTPFSKGHIRSRSATVVPANTLKEPNIQEVLDACRNSPTKEDIDLLENVIMKMRVQMKSASDRWNPLPVNTTITAITMSQPYSFELYTSLRSKQALLDRAIAVHDGNAITAVTLFLKNSLSSSKFIAELKKRPTASKHYLSYLKSRFDHQEMLDFYRLTGQKEEEAMLEYKLSLSRDSGADGRIRNLQTCYRSHFQHNPALTDQAAKIQEQIGLLERQRPIEMSDFEDEKAGRVRVFRDHPRNASIINMSVITTLYYCSVYHYDKTENHLACPTGIKKAHQLTERQYVWPVLSARSRMKCWLDIDNLFTEKRWYGGTQMRAVIGFDKVADVLHKTSAPTVIVGKYLRALDDSEHRLVVAKQYHCHDVVVDTLVSLKRREELETYKSRLTPNTEEFFYARNALGNSTTRWK